MLLISLVLWLAATACFFHYERKLGHAGARQGIENFGIGLLTAGATTAAFALWQKASMGRMPFTDSQTAVIGLSIVWVMIGISFVVIMRIPLLGLIIAPLAALGAAAAVFAPVAPEITRLSAEGPGETAGVILHALLGFAGYSAFLSAALGAGLFLLLDRELRLKRFSAVAEHLPSLDRSCAIIRVGIKSGLWFFICAIAAASVFLRRIVPPAELIRDSNIHAIAAIFVYATAVFWVGSRKGWSRPAPVMMTLILGFLVIAIHTAFLFGVSFHSFVG